MTTLLANKDRFCFYHKVNVLNYNRTRVQSSTNTPRLNRGKFCAGPLHYTINFLIQSMEVVGVQNGDRSLTENPLFPF
jgi:hypothetical protein